MLIYNFLFLSSFIVYTQLEEIKTKERNIGQLKKDLQTLQNSKNTSRNATTTNNLNINTTTNKTTTLNLNKKPKNSNNNSNNNTNNSSNQSQSPVNAVPALNNGCSNAKNKQQPQKQQQQELNEKPSNSDDGHDKAMAEKKGLSSSNNNNNNKKEQDDKEVSNEVSSIFVFVLIALELQMKFLMELFICFYLICDIRSGRITPTFNCY